MPDERRNILINYESLVAVVFATEKQPKPVNFPADFAFEIGRQIKFATIAIRIDDPHEVQMTSRPSDQIVHFFTARFGCGPKRAMRQQSGYSLLEVLVVIIVIVALVAMLLPAVGAARNAARRQHCRRNIGNLAMAAIRHEQAAGYYPAGVIAETNDFRFGRHSGFVALLPFLSEQSLFDRYDHSARWDADVNRSVIRAAVTAFHCPENVQLAGTKRIVFPNDGLVVGPTDYAFCKGDEAYLCIQPSGRGIFDINSRTRTNHIRDGQAQTFLFGEANCAGVSQGWATANFDGNRNYSTGNRGGNGSVLAATYQNSGPDGEWHTKDDVLAMSGDLSFDANPGPNCHDPADRVRGFSAVGSSHFAYADGHVNGWFRTDLRVFRASSTMAEQSVGQFFPELDE